MARRSIDITGNESFPRALAEIQDNFVDLYASGGGLTVPIAVASGGTGSITAGAARTALGAAASGANADVTSLTGLTTALSVAQGGTASTTAAAARTVLGAAASGANADITSLNPNGTSLATSGAANGVFTSFLIVNPGSTSSGIYQGAYGKVTHPVGASLINAGGHVLGILGHLDNKNTSQTLNLGIGIEGKIDNAAGCTITNAVISDINLGSNAGTITNLFGAYHDYTNSGTVALAALMTWAITNTGTYTNLVGLYLPNMGTPGTITTLTGFHFAAQSGGTVGTKHCINCLDATADILTIGPITTTNKTTTNTIALDTGTKTVTAAAGAATLNKSAGKVTSEALTTAAAAVYTLTLTNSQVAAADQVFASLANGTNSAGIPTIDLITPAAGSVTIAVRNTHLTAAFNGTVVISFMTLKN